LAGKLSLSFALILAIGPVGKAEEPSPPTGSTKTTAEWLRVLRDPDTPFDDSERARRALGPAGPHPKEAVAALIDALGDPRDEVNARVAQTLADHGPVVVSDLVRALKRPEAGARAGSAAALRQVRPRPVEAAPALIAALADRAASVRREAATALGRVRGPADASVPALANALKDSDSAVREEAARALGRFGPRARAAVTALTVALKDSEANVANGAADALGQVGPAAAAAAPALIDVVRAEKSLIDRERAVETLAAIGPGAKEAVPALVEALRAAQSRDRRPFVVALGAIGPDAKVAIPELIGVAEKGEAWVDALTALGRIGPAAKAAVPVLMEVLTSREYPMVRADVATALGGIGPDAKAAVRALMAVARDRKEDSLAREAAAQAVIKIDPALAAKEGMETAHLNVRAGKTPEVAPARRPATTAEQKKRIRELIVQLAEIKSPDFGLSASVTGRAFAPVAGHASWQMGLLDGEQQRPSDAFRTLVEMGPSALPYLLEALEDRTPTKLIVPDATSPVTSMYLDTYLLGNPLNRAEARALARPAATEDDDDGVYESYKVKVGDVCFVAVGQIVGRPYLAVRYQPTAIVVVTSPVESARVRDRVRTAWAGPDPTRRLFDSLLFDYATEGLFNGDSLDGWDEGSEFQIEAAIRLLYYFPGEAAPLIAARLRSFDVKGTVRGDGSMKREVKNGVRTVDFIKAVRWSKEPVIREALADIAKRTDDPDIKDTLSTRPK